MSQANIEGGQLLDRLLQYERKFDAGQHLETGGRVPVASGNAMPARYYEPGPMDDVIQAKQDIAAAANAGGAGSRPVPVTDLEVGAFLQSKYADQQVQFEQWFAENWPTDASDPVKQRWAQSVVPEFFSKREQVIADQADVQKRLAMIKLRGPKERADLELLYAIHTGTVTVPTTPLHGLVGTTLAATTRGPFNPIRLNQLDKAQKAVTGVKLAGANLFTAQTGNDRMPQHVRANAGANINAPAHAGARMFGIQ